MYVQSVSSFFNRENARLAEKLARSPWRMYKLPTFVAALNGDCSIFDQCEIKLRHVLDDDVTECMENRGKTRRTKLPLATQMTKTWTRNVFPLSARACLKSAL